MGINIFQDGLYLAYGLSSLTMANMFSAKRDWSSN